MATTPPDPPLGPPPPRPSPATIYTLGTLGIIVLPPVLGVVGVFLGGMINHREHRTIWDIVFWPWVLLGTALAGGPVLRATWRYPKLPGSRVRVWGAILGAIASAAGFVFSAFGFAFSGVDFGHGRPLRRKGRAVSAPAAPVEAWSAPVRPDLVGLDPEVREALASEWLEDARLEHASVAAFARLSLDLLAAGAPPDLVARCHRAAAEEVEHARQCFALAGAYAGRALGPGRFPEATESGGVERPAHALARLAVESLVDGCFGEGAAAESLAEAAGACADRAVAEVLRAAAREEANHAELSWDVLAWAVREGGAEVEREAGRALDAIRLPDEQPSRWPAAVMKQLATRGRLPAARERAIRGAALARVRARWGARGTVC